MLALALLTHIGLGLFKLAARTTLRMPPWEAIQIGLGLLIPFLLLPHIVNTRIAHVVLRRRGQLPLRAGAPVAGQRPPAEHAARCIVWLHGCIGVHFWLRLHTPYRAAQPVLLFIAIAVPLAALGGFMVSGRTVASSIENAQTLAKVKELTHWPNAADGASLELYRWAVPVRLCRHPAASSRCASPCATSC